jgi:hemolysin activation/secretion protein
MLKLKILWIACLLGGARLLAAAVGAAESPPPSESGLYPLRQIIVTDTLESIANLNYVPGTGFVVVAAPAFAKFEKAELLKRLQAGELRSINDRLLAAIAQVVENFARQSGYALATALIPPQNIRDGAVRVVVLPGKIRSIKFEGNRWFSESLLTEKLRLERGRAVLIPELEQALASANNSPFRRVKLHVEPVPGTGEADLMFAVQDRLPLRATASYENTGNNILGYDRYIGSLTYGNLWGREHQLTYQQAISHSTTLFRMHAFDYRAPLPSGHVATVSGSLAQVNPTFNNGLFTQVGKSINADAKYVVPVRFKGWDAEVTAGIMFKQSNNNLEFGDIQAFGSSHDILSSSLGIAAVRPDLRGRWILSATVFGSWGEFNSRSTEDVYGDVRVGARPRFFYASFWGQRVTNLTPQLTSIARLSAQLAGTNLLPSEQFSAGGASSVRGYEERTLSGDGGYIATHELIQTLPSVSLGKKLPKLNLSGAFFWDYGRTLIKHPLIGETKSAYLSSVGLGVRVAVAQYLSASADLARQLEKDETPGARHHRLHVKVSLSY